MYHVFIHYCMQVWVNCFLLGISAEMKESISSGLILSTNQIKMCACGRKRFCHSTDISNNGLGRCFIMKFIRDFNFCLKALAVMSCLLSGAWVCRNCFFISFHCGLQVNVVNRSGLYCYIVWHHILCVLVHVAQASGKIVILPTLFALSSALIASRK